MILQHSNQQTLECDICGELESLTRPVAFDPERKLIAIEDMEADHRPCESFKHDIPRAKRERAFIRRVRKQRRLLDERRRRGLRA